MYSVVLLNTFLYKNGIKSILEYIRTKEDFVISNTNFKKLSVDLLYLT